MLGKHNYIMLHYANIIIYIYMYVGNHAWFMHVCMYVYLWQTYLGLLVCIQADMYEYVGMQANLCDHIYMSQECGFSDTKFYCTCMGCFSSIGQQLKEN